MGSMILQVVANQESDRPQLEDALRSKLRDAVKEASKSRALPAGASLKDLAQREGVVKRLDANGDGRLQWSEVPPVVRPRIFEMADLNGDRVIDQEEIKKFRARQKKP
jgi:hypothetical protein